MKPTKSLPAETSAVWLSGDQYAAVHHPGKPSGHMKCWEWALWRWKGGTWIPYGVFFFFFFQLRISLERNSAAFLSSRRLGSTDSFVSMLSQSVCAQSAHSCSKEMDAALCSTLPSWGGNAFLYKLHCLQKRSVYMFLMYTAVSWCLSDLITWKPRALGSLYQSQCCCLHWLKPSLWNNFHNLV